MKRFIVLLTFISVIAVLSACLTKISLELIDTEVDIISDKNKVGSTILQEGEKKGKEVVPTSLYYTFSIKNEGNKKIGDINKGEGLSVKIEPNEKLLTTSDEVMGFNIFEPADYDEKGMGYGYSFVGIIEPNETGEFTIYYDLGFEEESTEVRLAPSKEQLDKLKDNALEATLIVLLEDEEIARFNLSENK